MTLDQMAKLFDKHNGEHLKFERVERRFSSRPDLHAFLLLEDLVPGDDYIVSAAEHDKTYLGVDPSDLARAVTEDQVVELLRCGVLYDEEEDSLFMFT